MNEIINKICKKEAWKEFVKPKFWNGKLEKPVIKDYKISLCTTCMNRLNDLKQTLPANIKDNLNYKNIEFVLLDYNSSDGLEKWIKDKMMKYIEEGVLNYYRTEEPKTFGMTHSRNVAFKLASGDIVNNVDADSFTNFAFANYLNQLANQIPEKAIFAKGKRMLRGRLGFYKKEFIDLLGGYDEDIVGYGHDDHDLLHRAWALGFTMFWWGGRYYGCVKNHRKHQMANYSKSERNWKYTENRNKVISFYNLSIGRFKANVGKEWGKARVVKNFDKEIEI